MEELARESVANSVIMEDLSELHALREEIRIFEAQYGLSFEQFEQGLEGGQEDFWTFEDYIDWKGAVKAACELQRRIEGPRRGQFKVA